MNTYISSYLFNGIMGALFASLLLIVCSRGLGLRRTCQELDFRFNTLRKSYRPILIFVIVFMIIYIFFGSLAANQHLFDYSFQFPLTIINILQWFIFQLLISGLEEIFFRCFVILLLFKLWDNMFTKLNYLQIAVFIASTLIFAARHIGFLLYPFQITYFVPLHLVVVSVLGIFLGILFIKTRSFWAVYAAHGFINGCIFTFLFVLNKTLS
ncbi:membrane protease YdiL (CAAX protease family) [Paenibacillus wynnii]|nr:membrane protease YdiL (CAAX protease family) [Paenibacillus wynnii]